MMCADPERTKVCDAAALPLVLLLASRPSPQSHTRRQERLGQTGLLVSFFIAETGKAQSPSPRLGPRGAWCQEE